jgi:uncharacterized membrane protein YvbJ
MASFCSSCGKPVKEGVKFCAGCGAAVGGGTGQAQQQQYQQHPQYQQQYAPPNSGQAADELVNLKKQRQVALIAMIVCYGIGWFTFVPLPLGIYQTVRYVKLGKRIKELEAAMSS